MDIKADNKFLGTEKNLLTRSSRLMFEKYSKGGITSPKKQNAVVIVDNLNV